MRNFAERIPRDCCPPRRSFQPRGVRVLAHHFPFEDHTLHRRQVSPPLRQRALCSTQNNWRIHPNSLFFCLQSGSCMVGAADGFCLSTLNSFEGHSLFLLTTFCMEPSFLFSLVVWRFLFKTLSPMNLGMAFLLGPPTIKQRTLHPSKRSSGLHRAFRNGVRGLYCSGSVVFPSAQL